MILYIKKTSYLLSLLLLTHGCTENFLFDDHGKANKINSIKGTISIPNTNTPDNIVVYLEEFDIITRTNSEGKFSLDIPESDLQNISGEFNVYFYISNYYLEKRKLVIVNGKIEKLQSGLNINNEFINAIALIPFMNLNIEPKYILMMTSDGPRHTMEFTYTIKVDSDTVSVLLPYSNSTFGVISAAFVDGQLVQTVDILHWVKKRYGRGTYTDKLQFNVDRFNVSDGAHTFSPVILANHQPVPVSLYKLLGIDERHKILQNWFGVPFKKQNFQFEFFRSGIISN